MPSHSGDKVCVFIDGGYVNEMLRQHYPGIKIDYLKLSEELCQGCDRWRTYYYFCPPYQSNSPTNEEREKKSKFDKFEARLKHNSRFEVRLGRLQKTNNTYVQKGVDVLLSIDLTQITASRVVDKAIIVSADSDFGPAIQRAKENMVIVSLASFSQHYSKVLFGLCDERITIDSDMISRISF